MHSYFQNQNINVMLLLLNIKMFTCKSSIPACEMNNDCRCGCICQEHEYIGDR